MAGRENMEHLRKTRHPRLAFTLNSIDEAGPSMRDEDGRVFETNFALPFVNDKRKNSESNRDKRNKIKIAVIGGPGSGKSSLIERFTRSEFSERASCTACELFGKSAQSNSCFAASINESISATPAAAKRRLHQYQERRCTCKRMKTVQKMFAYTGSDGNLCIADCVLMDVPVLPRFPQDTLQEFEMEEAIGVTSVNAYVLLFDVSNEKSYQYAENMRKDIQEFGGTYSAEASLYCKKGNYDDEVSSISIPLRRSLKRNNETSALSANRSSSVAATGCFSSFDAAAKHSEPIIVIAGTKLDLNPYAKTDDQELSWYYKEALPTIKKTWKHPYVTCSAKYGYQIDKVFYTAADKVFAAKGFRKKAGR